MSAKTILFTAFAVAALASSSPASLKGRNDQSALPPCPYPFASFVYSGCYYDDVYNRSLPFVSPESFYNMTVEDCAASCKANSYRYAGLEYYGQCYCGASIASGAAPEVDCNLTCNGAANEICGGENRLSIYEDPTFPDADDVAVSSDYTSLGCYTEGSNGRALAYSQYDFLNASLITTELCLDTCGSKGYAFAGTEFSGECYCGVVLDAGSVQAPDADCYMPCNGNPSETCGGPERLNLYVAKSLQSTQPCAPPSNSSSSSSSYSSTSYSSTTSSSLPYSSYSGSPYNLTTSSYTPQSSTTSSSTPPTSTPCNSTLSSSALSSSTPPNFASSSSWTPSPYPSSSPSPVSTPSSSPTPYSTPSSTLSSASTSSSWTPSRYPSSTSTPSSPPSSSPTPYSTPTPTSSKKPAPCKPHPRAYSTLATAVKA